MKTALILTLWVISVALHAAEPDFQSQHLAVGLSRSAPAFRVFAVDSLGQGKARPEPGARGDQRHRRSGTRWPDLQAQWQTGLAGHVEREGR